MRRRWVRLGLIAAIGTVGCASWRQPSTDSTDAPSSIELTAPSNTTGQEITPSSLKVESKTSGSVSSIPGSTPTGNTRTIPERLDDPLTLVAEAMDRGDKAQAANHLETYVRRHPDQAMFRLQLAELLVQVDQDARAKLHFERFANEVQAKSGPARDYVVHAHTRLMEIGQRTNDPFAEAFHRGVGLLILLQEQDRSPNRDGEFCEEMLCKALRALNEARELNPQDPRVRVYLAEIYERMGNKRGAATEREAARNRLIPDQLTPGERALILLRGS